MKQFSIYMIGVGGQGIGLLSEVLIRAADHAGLNVKGVDTHGLAQRGGIVVSRLKIGPEIHSPLIPQNEADLVISLERHEALRGLNTALKDGGTLVYYNTVWQPLEVRLNRAAEVSEESISEECRKRNIKEFKIFKADLKDARMQNIVVMANIDKLHLIPGIQTEHYRQAMEDLLSGPVLENNLKLFDQECAL